jgi:glyoxylase-like metal-dependent hydrolase (beta-lactamase superfamily II)
MDAIRRIPVDVDGSVPPGATNAYVVGREDALLVDPGGESQALERALDERAPSAALVTHAHPDHVGGLARYVREYDLDVYCRAGYASRFETTTGQSPDRTVRDGATLRVGDVAVRVTSMPGHAPDHVALTVETPSVDGERILVGDIAVAEGSVFVGAPDGDMRGYLTALRRLCVRGPAELLPGHGPPITTPRATLARLVSHRLDRERRVLAAVRDGAATPDAIVDAAYEKDLTGLRDLARRAVIAHLEKLAVEGTVAWDGERARPT